jgi:hypothetical protein
MHTEALRIYKILTENHMANFTLYGGYGMTYGGERITFPTGSIRNEKRNRDGRVTYSECHYEDGSYIVYRYNTRTSHWSIDPKMRK